MWDWRMLILIFLVLGLIGTGLTLAAVLTHYRKRHGLVIEVEELPIERACSLCCEPVKCGDNEWIYPIVVEGDESGWVRCVRYHGELPLRFKMVQNPDNVTIRIVEIPIIA